MRIIQNDFWAFNATIAPVVFWLFYALAIICKEETLLISVFLILAITTTVASPAVLFWRYKWIHFLYENGREAKAIIHIVNFYKGRGKIDYIYSYQGQKYLSENFVIKTKQTMLYKIGNEVDVLINPNNPKRATIKNLYI